MKTTLILGSNSDVGAACAHKFAEAGHRIILASRQISEKSSNQISDLKIRYKCEAEHVVFDALDTDSHQSFCDEISNKVDVVVSVFGVLGDHEQAINSYDYAKNILLTNLNGNVSILGLFANAMEKKSQGTLICISSVAGERGRMSNYIYGASKAGLTAFLSGLRNRLAHKGIHVASIQPGFIRTKMIEGIETPGPLTASPEEVAKTVFKAYSKKKNIVFVKPIWRLIMAVIRNIPEVIFKKLKL